MTLAPIARRSVADEVTDQLLERIVDGDLDAGAALPGERALAETLGVSRPAVREGLQRLAAAGLVDVRQGERTTVTDYRRRAGLDLLPHLLVRGGTVDLDVAADLFAARTAFGPVIAAAAADALRPGDRDLLLGHAEDLAALTPGRAGVDDAPRAGARRGDLGAAAGGAGDEDESSAVVAERQRRALDLWDAVVDATHNVAYRLLFNAFRATYEPALDLLTMVLEREVRDVAGHVAMVAAIVDRDPDRAAAAAESVLALGAADVTAVLASLRDHRARLAAVPGPELPASQPPPTIDRNESPA